MRLCFMCKKWVRKSFETNKLDQRIYNCLNLYYSIILIKSECVCVCVYLDALLLAKLSHFLLFSFPEVSSFCYYPGKAIIASHTGWVLLPSNCIFPILFGWLFLSFGSFFFVPDLCLQVLVPLGNVLKVQQWHSVRFSPSFLHLLQRQCDVICFLLVLKQVMQT